jgi:hypothetical protein
MRLSPLRFWGLEGRTDIMSVVMTVAQILGLAIIAVLLKRFTPLPLWAAFVLAFPLFFGAFWGLLWLLSRRRH